MVSGVSFLGLVVGLGIAIVHHWGKVHQHCIKAAGIALWTYAEDHGGAFPYNTNGFGDALLLLVKGDYGQLSVFCGPGDDGHVLSNALTNGLHVPEEACTRVYVQGFEEKRP